MWKQRATSSQVTKSLESTILKERRKFFAIILHSHLFAHSPDVEDVCFSSGLGMSGEPELGGTRGVTSGEGRGSADDRVDLLLVGLRLQAENKNGDECGGTFQSD